MKINWFKINIQIINGLVLKILLYLHSEDYYSTLNLIKLFTYLKQGGYCKDCEEHFSKCKCNNFENINEEFKFMSRWTTHNLSKFKIDNLLKNFPNKFINQFWSYYENKLV